MLHGILREILKTEGVSLVGDFAQRLPLLTVAERCSPDVIVTGADDADPVSVYRLLEANPTLRVLTVSPDGRGAFLSEVGPNRVSLGEASPQKLLTVIREAARVTHK
jgi:hypothetical protein